MFFVNVKYFPCDVLIFFTEENSVYNQILSGTWNARSSCSICTIENTNPVLNYISQLLFIDHVSFSLQSKVGNIRLQAVQYPTLRMFMYPCTRKKKKSSFNKRDTKHLLKSLWIQFTLVHQGQEPIWFKSISVDFKKNYFYCSRQSHLMVQHFTLWLMKSHVQTWGPFLQHANPSMKCVVHCDL